jgi:hypothetical protein
MGCGKNGTFDIVPDLSQWAILATHKLDTSVSNKKNLSSLYGNFIAQWISLFASHHITFLLDPIAGHGSWDGKQPFGDLPHKNNHSGTIVTLTRASIRLTKLHHFWKHVAPVAQEMTKAKGLIYSVGIGEVPWIKQATVSVWESEESMKQFAYGTQKHNEVIQKTRKEKWYSEDMFVRFRIVSFLSNSGIKHPVESFL